MADLIDETRLATGEMSISFAAMTLACSQIGSALVAIPSMFQQTQIGLGILIFLMLGFTMLLACYFLQQLWIHVRKQQCAQAAHQTYTALKNQNEPPKSPTLQYFSLLECIIKEKCSPGLVVAARRWTLAMQVIALGGTAVSEVIQVGGSMYIATGWQSPQLWAIICGCCVMTPLTWIPDYKRLERLSMVAVGAIIFTASVVTVSGMSTNPSEYQRCPPADFSVSKFFVSTSGFVFIWGGLALAPEVQSSMHKPSLLTFAMLINVLFCCGVCIPTGLAGLNFCRIGSQDLLKSNVLDQMPVNTMQRLAAAALSIHMIIAFAVLLMPLMEAFEGNHEALRTRMSLRLASRTGWALGCVLIGVAIPFFGDVVAVVASIAQVYLSFVAPPLMFILTFKSELKHSWWGCVQLGVAFVMAGGMFVLGTGFGMYASIYDLSENISSWGLFKRFY